MIRIICIGKIKEKYLLDLINDYLTRINKYHKLEIVELIDSNKKEEGDRISYRQVSRYRYGLYV